VIQQVYQLGDLPVYALVPADGGVKGFVFPPK
jgi:hypothetical protein